MHIIRFMSSCPQTPLEEQPSVTKPTKHRRPKKGRRKERESAGDDPVNSVRQPPEGEPTEARAPTEDRTWEVPPQADDSLPGEHASLLQLHAFLSSA